MKRDMDLARSILFEMEKFPFDGRNHLVVVDGKCDEEITGHLFLLFEAGLIHGVDVSSMDGPGFLPVRLTSSGHDFIDAARSDLIWGKAKSAILRTGGGLTLDLLKAVLIKVITGTVQ